MDFVKTVVVASLFSLLTGCATDLGYKTDRKSLENMAELSIIVDISVAEDVVGFTDMVDIPKNTVMGREAADAVLASLRGKGYSVSDATLVSIGGTFGEFQEHKVIHDDSERSFTAVGKDASPPPYYVDAEFDGEKERAGLLGLERSLAKLSYDRLTMLGDIGKKGDGLVVVEVTGYVSSLLKDTGKAALVVISGLAGGSGGSTNSDSDSRTEFRIYVIDTKEEKVVWAAREMSGMSPSTERVRSMAAKAASKIPKK